MTKLAKIMCCVTLPLALLFGWVGYAALSATLAIQGSAQAEMPNALYIAEIIVDNNSYSNAEPVGFDGKSGDPMEIDFPSTKFMCNINYKARNSYITFKVTVVNGTSTVQYFNKIKKFDDDTTYDYTGISGTNNPSASGIAQGYALKPKESVTFDVTITYSGWQGRTNLMLFDIEFVRDSTEVTKQASQAIVVRYKEIINDSGKYQQIFGNGQWNNYGVSSDGGDSGRYASNNDAAPDDQKELVKQLFGDVLKLEFENEEVPVTILLKDGPMCNCGQNERAIYITADSLELSGQQAPVFVVVFHQQNGQWVPVFGEDVLLEGTATIIAHDGSAGNGNFQTNEWKSTKQYKNAGIGSSLSTIISQYH